jgi:hypothetical protein
MLRDEFLDNVNQIINTNEKAGAGLKVSILGNLIRNSLRLHWNDFGFARLKEVLQELESRQQIRVGYDERDVFTVWALSNRDAPISPLVAVATKPTTPPPVRLRNAVWTAFVRALPAGRRFIHRETGEIRMGLFEAPPSEPEWIEIHRISDEMQRTWAREFIDTNSLSTQTELRDALNNGAWFVRFPAALRQLNPRYIGQWNRHHTGRVRSNLERWCQQHGINSKLIQEDHEPPRPSTTPTRPEATPTLVRQIILDALARMPTHELLQLPIAGKYLYPEESGTRPNG